MNSPHIRLATEQDVATLATLSGQLGYPTTPEQMTRRLADILPRPDHAVFVAEVDGYASGWIHVFACSMLEAEPFAEVGGLVVSESSRGLGAGRALMAQAEKWAKAHGLKEVRLRSNVIRKDAHRFYESIGYKNIKTSFTFHKIL